MSVLLSVVAVGVGVFLLIGAFNALISLKNQVANAWRQIDVQLKRRHDLVPNLIETVRGAMEFERDTLDAVVTARNQAISIERGNTNVAQTAAAESELSRALARLMAVVEAYPALKATGNIARLQEELTSTENKIAFARQLYNDTATVYNTRQARFPTNLVAGMAGASPVDLWELGPTTARTAPPVDLSLRPVDRSRV